MSLFSWTFSIAISKMTLVIWILDGNIYEVKLSFCYIFPQWCFFINYSIKLKLINLYVLFINNFRIFLLINLFIYYPFRCLLWLRITCTSGFSIFTIYVWCDFECVLTAYITFFQILNYQSHLLDGQVTKI